MDPILDQFRTPGTFTFSAGDASASFLVGDLTGAIDYLKASASQFPEVSDSVLEAPPSRRLHRRR